MTRSKLLERCKSFLRFCVEAGWLAAVPKWPKIQVETTPTMPLTLIEYNRLLDAAYAVVRSPENPTVENRTYEYSASRVRGLYELMRWSGLSIQDALILDRPECSCSSCVPLAANNKQTNHHPPIFETTVSHVAISESGQSSTWFILATKSHCYDCSRATSAV
jgi:hypothetical protein